MTDYLLQRKKLCSSINSIDLDSQTSIAQEQQDKLKEIRHLCSEAEQVDKEALKNINERWRKNKYFEKEFHTNLDILNS